jgi:cell pole-organizing protein PopZ
MAQSSAAREPTMEEILASIRRIIESNDESAPPRVEPRPQLASIAGDGPAAAEEPASLEIATLTEPHPAAAAPRATAAAAPAISLADVAARLRSRDERPAPAPSASLSVANDDSFDIAEEEPEGDETKTLSAAPQAFEPDEGDEPELTDEPVKASAETLPREDRRPEMTETSSRQVEQQQPASPSVEPARTSEAAPSAEAEFTPRTEAGGSSALVSMETGTKVAAAFDDLNAAIAEGRMRSFEELAQELLRPMLSEWLDDNLPTLVERLVREEIERVARGGRR